MNKLSPEELVGQSIMFRFAGPIFTGEAKAAFAEIRPCGVLYFGDNITSREQIHALSAELQAEARRIHMPTLLIAIDQEGGVVSRFSPDMTTVPGAMALTASSNVDDTRASARITGEQLAEVGINVNFAPVVDVNNNPGNPVIRTRSFGESVGSVIAGALATIDGLTDAGIVATVKHFPGHGDTEQDSHLGLPVIHHPRSRLAAVELAPFKAAIAAGIPAVMSSHILFPDLDTDPATLSLLILTGILRRELGFEGVIFSDSLSMKAIEERYGHGDSAVRCKLAGIDVLETNEFTAHQRARFQALLATLEDGTIPMSVFERTAERLQKLREQFDIGHDPGKLKPATPSWNSRAKEIATRTIATLPNGRFEPIATNAQVGIIDFQRFRASEVEGPFSRAEVFRMATLAIFPRDRIAPLGHEPHDSKIAAALADVNDVDALAIMTRDATDNPNQVDVALRAISRIRPGTRVIHIALRGPYDAGLLGPVDATLTTFGDPAVTLQVLPRILAGFSPPTASFPTTS